MSILSRTRPPVIMVRVGDAAEDVVRRLYQAVADVDFDAAERCFAPDALWHLPGRSPIAGDHRGWAQIRDNFLAKLGPLSGGTFRAELLDVAVGDTYVVAVQRATASRGKRTLDITGCQLIFVRDAAIINRRDRQHVPATKPSLSPSAISVRQRSTFRHVPANEMRLRHVAPESTVGVMSLEPISSVRPPYAPARAGGRCPAVPRCPQFSCTGVWTTSIRAGEPVDKPVGRVGTKEGSTNRLRTACERSTT